MTPLVLNKGTISRNSCAIYFWFPSVLPEYPTDGSELSGKCMDFWNIFLQMITSRREPSQASVVHAWLWAQTVEPLTTVRHRPQIGGLLPRCCWSLDSPVQLPRATRCLRDRSGHRSLSCLCFFSSLRHPTLQSSQLFVCFWFFPNKFRCYVVIEPELCCPSGCVLIKYHYHFLLHFFSLFFLEL